jgi:ABC-type uncharacterized transport system substrate-binding protein
MIAIAPCRTISIICHPNVLCATSHPPSKLPTPRHDAVVRSNYQTNKSCAECRSLTHDRERLAAASATGDPVRPSNGGLLSYGPHQVDTYRRGATYVDRILRGEKPNDLPVQFPVKYEMAVNLKTAKALGLTVPQSMLLRADEVIE